MQPTLVLIKEKIMLTEKEKSDNYLLRMKIIPHYERMIAWAENNPFAGTPSMDLMRRYIGESWGGLDCEFCKRYTQNCKGCPLFQKYGPCSSHAVSNLWQTLSYTGDFKKWAESAKKFLEQLKTLIVEDKDAEQN